MSSEPAVSDSSAAPQRRAAQNDVRAQVSAALRAGRELGPEYDDALAATIVEQLDERIDERVRAAVARQPSVAPGSFSSGQRMALVVLSLVAAVPLSAIGAGMGGPIGLVGAWLGIFLINLFVLIRR